MRQIWYHSDMERWIYAAACVLLPMAWGLFIVNATGWIERLFRRGGPNDKSPVAGKSPTPEYHI